eukprot:TRINITY_DN3941_c0_g1_i3.p1 TRINITY_DN3941_c0_g1~~TRINITY_DN3941_c0_g1_i3.p1  ORF type:complete len:297 (+),score=37.13 TRINITY_DN3941_c0_g1_i3:26-892(+)
MAPASPVKNPWVDAVPPVADPEPFSPKPRRAPRDSPPSENPTPRDPNDHPVPPACAPGPVDSDLLSEFDGEHPGTAEEFTDLFFPIPSSWVYADEEDEEAEERRSLLCEELLDRTVLNGFRYALDHHPHTTAPVPRPSRPRPRPLTAAPRSHSLPLLRRPTPCSPASGSSPGSRRKSRPPPLSAPTKPRSPTIGTPPSKQHPSPKFVAKPHPTEDPPGVGRKLFQRRKSPAIVPSPFLHQGSGGGPSSAVRSKTPVSVTVPPGPKWNRTTVRPVPPVQKDSRHTLRAF